MKILKSWLQDHIVEKLPSDEAITEAFTLKSSEVEGVEKTETGDTIFDLKVLPDRAHYMLSHRGVAYDLCAILNLTLKKESSEIPKIGGDVKVEVESDLCSRYSAVSISNITNTPSPKWLQERLEAIGARSINLIVDCTNYAMFDTGQPLHAFDADKMVGGITVRLAKEGESIETLSGQVIKLKTHHLVIADDAGPLALAGVKGGKRAEVTLETKRIILESANFNPVSVRKTSLEVGIRNDSSKRFENEITPYLTEKGISVFLQCLKKFAPDSVVGSLSDTYKKLPEAWTVNVTHKNIEAILNYSIEEKRVVEILEKLGCKVKVSDSIYSVTPPFERLDIVIAEDVIDEIGRIQGLDKIKSIVPNTKTSNEFSQEFLLTEKVKDFFAARGFSEVVTRSFTNKGDIEVAYPMASDKGFLRTSLVAGVTNSMNQALGNAPLLGMDKICIFEIGKTFPASGEQLDLCFGLTYVKKIKNKADVVKKENEEILEQLVTELGVKLDSSIDANGYGYVKNLEKLNTKLTPESIEIKKGSRVQFVPFSSSPYIMRDIALFVDSSVSVDQVKDIIKTSILSSAKELLVKGPDLFDQFEKEGKKSLAYRMIFQAQDRTLTDEEVNGFMEKLYTVVKEKGWQVR
jgi:phenylalanyl-tRNA synthetase beta chain